MQGAELQAVGTVQMESTCREAVLRWSRVGWGHLGEVGGSGMGTALIFPLCCQALRIAPAVIVKQPWRNQGDNKGGKAVALLVAFILFSFLAREGRNKVGFQVGLLQ